MEMPANLSTSLHSYGIGPLGGEGGVGTQLPPRPMLKTFPEGKDTLGPNEICHLVVI